MKDFSVSVIVDFNYLAFSEYSIFANYGKSIGRFKDERDEISFVSGLTNKLLFIINSLPTQFLILCCDSHSWRKTILIENGGYKISRERSDGSKGMMDKGTKDIFYRLIDEFTIILKNKGIIVSKIPGAEGDDLMYRWSDHFYRNGDNTIIVSGDHDLTQCVRGNSEPWTVMWNNNSKHNRIFTAPGWKDGWLKNSPNTIFEFSMSADKDVFAKLIRDNGISVDTVNTQEVVMHKILLGDDGDDVPSVWSFDTKDKKGNDKTVRVTEKKVDTIIGYLKTQFGLADANLMSMWEDETFLAYMSGVILRVSGDVDDAAKRVLVRENMERNAKLVWLSDKTLPINLVSMMDEHICASAELPASREKWSRKKLLEGTRFDTGSGAPASMDPFVGMNLDDLK